MTPQTGNSFQDGIDYMLAKLHRYKTEMDACMKAEWKKGNKGRHAYNEGRGDALLYAMCKLAEYVPELVAKEGNGK